MATNQNPGSTSGAGTPPGPDINALKKDITEIANRLKAAGAALGFDLQKAFRDANNDVGKLEDILKRLNKEYDELTNKVEETYQIFRDITAELQNQNTSIKAGKASFRELTDIARDLSNYTSGTADLTKRQLKSLEQNLAIETKELETLVDILEANQSIRLAEIERLKNTEYTKSSLKAQINALEQQKINNNGLNAQEEQRLKRLKDQYSVTDGLSTSQKKRLSDLEKEQSLLENSKEALNQNIPVLQRELDLSKQIYGVRQDVGGIVTKTGKLLSSLNLGQFFDVSAATEAAENYSKNLIQGALKNKKVQEDLAKVEAQKATAINAFETQRKAIFKSNLSDQEKQNALKRLDGKETERLKELDEKALKIKKDAVKSTDTLANKFGVLKVFAKELGEGLKKALLDPVTLIVLFTKAAFQADTQVTELGKSLGVSKNLALGMREDMAKFSGFAFDSFVNVERLMKAQSELSRELGIAVKFSNEELAAFAKLTELTGLTAAEAGKLATFSGAAGKTIDQYTDELRVAAYHAQQTTKTHFSSKEILQDISKLSSGILIKFQNNPKALAEAVVQAKALGLTLDKIDKTGESLLNWESSIENELKAELLTGRQLNFERARAAALTGDQATLMSEIASQAGSLADFQNMNVIAQKSLADAFGMSRDEMADMLLKQELINKYGSQAANLNAEQAKEFQKSGLSLEEYLKKQEQQQAAQDKFNDAIIKLKELVGNIVAGPLGKLFDAFANIAGVVVNVLGPPLTGISMVIGVIAKGLEYLATPLKIVAGLFLAIHGTVYAIAAVQKTIAAVEGTIAAIKGKSLATDVAINIQKSIANARTAVALATEGGRLSISKLIYITEGESLLTRTLAYGMGLKDLVVQQSLAAWTAIKTATEKDGFLTRMLAYGIALKDVIVQRSMAAFAAFRVAAENSIVVALIRQGAIMLVNLGRAIATAVAEITGASAATLGIAAAIALAAGAAAFIFLSSKKANDLKSEGGYGKRTLLTPEGTFKLNDKDTVVAGTDNSLTTIGNKTNSAKNTELGAKPMSLASPIINPIVKPSSGPAFDSTSIVKAVDKLASATMEMSKRPVTAQINGKDAFADNLGRVNALGTSQNRNTYSFA